MVVGEKVDYLLASAVWTQQPQPVDELIHLVKHLMTIYLGQLLGHRSVRPEPHWSPEPAHGLEYRP